MSKSYVSMEQHQCPVCLSVFDTGNLLFDTRLKDRFAHHTLTGHSLCKACQEKKDAGYIALIEADETTRARTGVVAHIRASVWPHVFNTSPPEGGIAMCGPDVMRLLQAEAQRANIQT